ncbi:MAG: hypothetical protein V7719_04565 [Psychroserpens sp.]|uniref:hypothetical protein n=1 Tax=Psychroserpens sp. TaxID=2020870 RepID=UPI003001A2EB
MNENADKHLDDLTRKVIGKSAMERPSLDFTQTIMSQIKALKTSKITTYVPLISKRMWSIMAVGMVAILVYIGLSTSGEESSWLNNLGLERFSNYELSNPLAGIEFSQTLVYAVLLFAIMLCIQIPILKRHFDKRFES